MRAVHRDDVHAGEHLVETVPIGRLQRLFDLRRDALVICGGPSVPDLFWNDKKLGELAAAMAAAGKVVAAISLSTVVLARAKLLAGKKATVYFLPQALQELKAAGADYVTEPLVVQEELILAEGPTESARFGQAISMALAG